MDYKKLVDLEESKTIAIDFDGVIHSHHLGFYDGTIYGNPIKGSLESIRKLSEKFNIIIFTAKAKPDRPLIKGKSGIELVWDWLKKYGIDNCIKEVTSEKPRAICYIDDKAIKFENWNQVLIDLKNFTNEEFNY